MSDFEKRNTTPMIEEWPEPDTIQDDDEWDTEEPPTAYSYEVKFRVSCATQEQIDSISRYLFDAIAKELAIPYEQLEDLEIEED